MTRKDIYVDNCYKYGVLTLCYLMQEYEKDEDYEKCQIVLDAINEVSEFCGEELPKVYNEETELWLRAEICKITGTDGKLTIRNIPAYADLIMLDIFKHEFKEVMKFAEIHN